MDLTTIRIDEIVVHGASVRETAGFRSDLGGELRRLLVERGVPRQLRDRPVDAHQPLEAQFTERPGQRPGIATARALYEELAR